MADELGHLIRQAAQQANIDYRPHLYGHIASYDPMLHRVRCIVPSMTDENGSPLLTPWMPMGTTSSGDGYGIQVVYKGGASVANPTAGEQVLISLFDKVRGVSAVPCMFYHNNARPPATNLPTQSDGFDSDAVPIAAGDVIISNPPQTDGGVNTNIRLRASGDIEMWGSNNLITNVLGDIELNAKPKGLAENLASNVLLKGDVVQLEVRQSDSANTFIRFDTDGLNINTKSDDTVTIISGSIGLVGEKFIQISSISVILPNIPTSPAGLPPGGLWRDNNKFVRIV